MDSIYHPVLREDNSSNIAVIQPRKQKHQMLSIFYTFDSVLMFENTCNKNFSAPYIDVKEAYGIKDTCKLSKWIVTILIIFSKSLQCLSNVYIVSVVK